MPIISKIRNNNWIIKGFLGLTFVVILGLIGIQSYEALSSKSAIVLTVRGKKITMKRYDHVFSKSRNHLQAKLSILKEEVTDYLCSAFKLPKPSKEENERFLSQLATTIHMLTMPQHDESNLPNGGAIFKVDRIDFDKEMTTAIENKKKEMSEDAPFQSWLKMHPEDTFRRPGKSMEIVYIPENTEKKQENEFIDRFLEIKKKLEGFSSEKEIVDYLKEEGVNYASSSISKNTIDDWEKAALKAFAQGKKVFSRDVVEDNVSKKYIFIPLQEGDNNSELPLIKVSLEEGKMMFYSESKAWKKAIDLKALVTEKGKRWEEAISTYGLEPEKIYLSKERVNEFILQGRDISPIFRAICKPFRYEINQKDGSLKKDPSEGKVFLHKSSTGEGVYVVYVSKEQNTPSSDISLDKEKLFERYLSDQYADKLVQEINEKINQQKGVDDKSIFDSIRREYSFDLSDTAQLPDYVLNHQLQQNTFFQDQKGNKEGEGKKAQVYFKLLLLEHQQVMSLKPGEVRAIKVNTKDKSIVLLVSKGRDLSEQEWKNRLEEQKKKIEEQSSGTGEKYKIVKINWLGMDLEHNIAFLSLKRLFIPPGDPYGDEKNDNVISYYWKNEQ